MRPSRGAVRFWVSAHGSPVRLTLRPGQTLTRTDASPTDEGWRRRCESWRREGDAVIWEWSVEERDCDGRTAAGGAFACHLSELASKSFTFRGETHHGWPKWWPGDEWRRDYAAEAAGY